MGIRFVDGDLFDLDLPALGHGCNCEGSMAGGVARIVAQRYPALHEEYRRRCAERTFRLGDAWPWQADSGPLIYNLATQQLPGPHADLVAIRGSVARMLADAERRGLPEVGVPRIGAGIGGLEWTDVRQVLEQVGTSSPVMLTVITKRDAGRREQRRRRPSGHTGG